MVDPGDANDRVHERRHLGPPIHQVGVRDLDGAGRAVVGRDRLRALGGLLGVGRGERLGLDMPVSVTDITFGQALRAEARGSSDGTRRTFFMYEKRPFQFHPTDCSESSSRLDIASYWAFRPRVQWPPLIELLPPSVLPLVRGRVLAVQARPRHRAKFQA